MAIVLLIFMSTYEGNYILKWKYFELKPSEKNDDDVVVIKLTTSLSYNIFLTKSCIEEVFYSMGDYQELSEIYLEFQAISHLK
jgi:hypothetical protein